MKPTQFNPGDVVHGSVTGRDQDHYEVTLSTVTKARLDVRSIPEDVLQQLTNQAHHPGYCVEVIVVGWHRDAKQLQVSMLDSCFKRFGKSKGYSPGDVTDAVVMGHIYMHHWVKMPSGELAFLEVVNLPEDVETKPGDQVYPVGSTIEVIVVYRRPNGNQLQVGMRDSFYKMYGKSKTHDSKPR